jgi:HTH-type transcriptional regulator/antitoxin HigA
MKATLIVIENDEDLAEAQALVARLMRNGDDTSVARLQAQARLIEAYETNRWPPRRVKVADLLRYLMDQHDLTRTDLMPLLGGANRVSEVLSGKKQLSMSMVQRLRARFGIPADLLIPEPPSAGRRKLAA